MNKGPHAEPRYFFDDGLNFECQRCGRCCTGTPGRVRLSAEERRVLAAFLKMSEGSFVAECCRPAGEVLSLRERDNGDCIFYESGCKVYEVRPAQCRLYPFWLSILRSEERWHEEGRSCPGINRGRRHSREEILERLVESPL